MDCSRPPPRAGTRTQATTVSLCTSSPPHRSISVSILLPSAVRRSLSSRSLRCVLVATVLSPPRLPRLTHRRAHWRQGASTSPDGGGNFHQLRVGRKGPWILIGAPRAPPPPRCAIPPRAPAARLSPARREQAGDGPSSLHVPRRDEGARRMGPHLRRLNLRRLRARGVAAAYPAGRPAVRDGAARERGRRRSTYGAPHGPVAPGPG